MRLSGLKATQGRHLLVVAMLAVLLYTTTGCEFGPLPSPTPTPEQRKVEATPAPIKTKDRAISVVYEHLLGKAQSPKAKVYLADFYATCDRWSAESERLEDWTTVWYVAVDMTGIEGWRGKPHWRQAGWVVFQDGKVMPSTRHQANALRIEADLEELSSQ